MLGELARLNLVPEIWLPDPAVRAERERARFRLHLVKHRSSLKNRVHAILFQHGVPSPGSDLFGAGGRRLLERLALPEPWASTLSASLSLIDTLDEQIHACERELRQLGADHPYVPLLVSCPGIAWILGFTSDDAPTRRPARAMAVDRASSPNLRRASLRDLVRATGRGLAAPVP